MNINKQIMRSRNKGLFYSLIEEMKKQPFKLVFKVNYLNSLRFKGYVLNKTWLDVYNIIEKGGLRNGNKRKNK